MNFEILLMWALRERFVGYEAVILSFTSKFFPNVESLSKKGCFKGIIKTMS